MKIYLGIPRYMNTKLDRFPTETVRLFQRINLINSRDISIKDFTMRSSTLNKTREERDTSRRSFRGALFDEDHKIHLRNWSSQRSLIHSSSLVVVYAVNSSFQNKPIDPRVPRQCHCTFGIPANDLHIFFFSLPFSRVYSRATRVSRGIYALYADVMNVHRARQECLSIFSQAMRKEESYHGDENFAAFCSFSRLIVRNTNLS